MGCGLGVAPALAVFVACAGPAIAPSPESGAPPSAAPAPPSSGAVAPPVPPPRAGATAAPVTRGMSAADVRRALGEPTRIEQVASSAARGARYERWSYPSREVVLLDGKVVDVVSW